MFGPSGGSPMVVGMQEHQEMLGCDSLDLYHCDLDLQGQCKQRHGLKFSLLSRRMAFMSHSKDLRILSLPAPDSFVASTSPESYLLRRSRASFGSTTRSRSDLHAKTMNGSFKTCRRSKIVSFIEKFHGYDYVSRQGMVDSLRRSSTCAKEDCEVAS
jgi:hypothetical protein